MFARATFRDKDKDTKLHGREYKNSVAPAKCVDTQAPVSPTVDPRSGVPTPEGEPADSSTQNTLTAGMTATGEKQHVQIECFCIEHVEEQVGYGHGQDRPTKAERQKQKELY